MEENTRIAALKGIGEKTEKLFQKLGVYTLGDLIRYYPRSYDAYEKPLPIGDLLEERVQTVTGTVCGGVRVSKGRNMQITSLSLKDETGTLEAVWFRMPFLKKTLSAGGTLTLRGKALKRKAGLVMEQPEIFYPSSLYEDRLSSMQPVYALTAGLSNRVILKAVKLALESLKPERGRFWEEICASYRLMGYREALWEIHFPKDKETLYRARERLVFEEFSEFIIRLRELKERNKKKKNDFCIEEKKEVGAFLNELPYELTKAQKRVWGELLRDITSPFSMSRLVQGDVGSGKTILAFLALLTVGLNGCQGAFMGPTETLAKQHFEAVKSFLSTYKLPLKAELLTGSLTPKEKREAYARIREGEVSIIVGTHALIQEKVAYKKLALVVTDEQHRFGVRQRELLAEKGCSCHTLIMSATPIPRTLAIILYGDLDISVVDELPSNRLPIKNCVVNTNYRKSAYEFMKKQIKEGRQCYIICPLAEESENVEGEDVISYTAALKEEMGKEIRIEYLCGKMKQVQKDRVMASFAAGEIKLLVSTTVIEVGIDVPNASVIMIENAERFGLSQLHQLRGRVGRGKYQSYCIFMSSAKSKELHERLKVLNETNDGFKIAAEDLRLRGPGDLFGIRQSGLMNFKLGDIFQDAGILQMANEAAGSLLKTKNGSLKKMAEDERTASVIL